MVLGAALGVLAANMPVVVETGFEQTRASIVKCVDTDFNETRVSNVECIDTAFEADDSEGVNYSYVPAQNVASEQVEINEAIKLIIEAT